jgi:hypothetical protein
LAGSASLNSFPIIVEMTFRLSPKSIIFFSFN